MKLAKNLSLDMKKKKFKYNVLNQRGGKRTRLYLDFEIPKVSELQNLIVNGKLYGIILEGCNCNCLWLVDPHEGAKILNE